MAPDNKKTEAPVKVNWQLARSMVEPLYAGQCLETGEPRMSHADGMASILRGIRDDGCPGLRLLERDGDYGLLLLH